MSLRSIIKGRVDDRFYVVAMTELTEKRADPGTLARSIAFSNGSEDAARSYYVRERALDLADAAINAKAEVQHRERKASEEVRKRMEDLRAKRITEFLAVNPKAVDLPDEIFDSLFVRFTNGENVSQIVLAESAKYARRTLVMLIGVMMLSFIVLVALVIGR